MNRCLHSVRMGALAVLLLATLANCGGGGNGSDDPSGPGGPDPVTLFFGMNGLGSCSSVAVNVNLASASAVLARKSDNTPDCSLSPELTADGCDVSFSVLNGGDRLRVTIDGCTIPEDASLFSCGFTEVDISELSSEITATCVCTHPGCDQTPPICVSQDEDPASCERCDNRRDDDGNGLVDCDDPNCEHAPSCEGSSVTSTTTTTLPDGPMTIHFLLSSSGAPVGALQLTVNYTSAPGRFDGDGVNVDCDTDLRGVVFTANNSDPTSKLRLGFVSTSGITAPEELASCRFTPDTPAPVPANFTVVVNEANGVNGGNVHVRVDTAVSPAE